MKIIELNTSKQYKYTKIIAKNILIADLELNTI